MLGLLTVFAAFITTALIAHWITIDMRPGARAAWYAFAVLLAIAAAVFATPAAAYAAGGYLVWRSAGYVRERRQLTRFATNAEQPERNPR